MNLESFRQSPAGQVIKVGQGSAAYWAFVPHPLPPLLSFDTQLVNTLSTADRALGELAGLGRTLLNPNLLVQPFIRREAVFSSRIEGTRSDITNLYAYEAGQLFLPGFTPPVAEADVKEVLNYVNALTYGLARLDTLPISLRFLRELHEKLMTGVRGDKATPGEFRRTQNWIGRPGSTLNEATFVPPPAQHMLDALDAFENYLHQHDDYPPLVRLAFIHYQFEAIHPFIDGNGRIGRLLLVLLMVHWNLLPAPLLYLSAYFERLRSDYYDLLLAVSERGAWHEWVLFFLQGVYEQAEDTNVRVHQLQDLQAEWQQRLQRARISGLMGAVVSALFESPVLSSGYVQSRWNVSHPTAMKILRRLAEMEIVEEVSGRGRKQLFSAAAILKILQQ
jgi:Fic family protein